MHFLRLKNQNNYIGRQFFCIFKTKRLKLGNQVKEMWFDYIYIWMDKPNFTNILKNINMSSNDFFYNENKNYLNNLTNSLKLIIENLKLVFISDISATYEKHIQPICIQSDESNLIYFNCKNQLEQKQINKFTMELDYIITNINLLIGNIPCYYKMDKLQLKEILSELVLFHNNIINKIKEFLIVTLEYHNQLNQICGFLDKHCEIINSNLKKLKIKSKLQMANSIKIVGTHLFANTDNQSLTNSNLFTDSVNLCHQQIGKINQIKYQENILQHLMEYSEHYNKQAKIFANIKTHAKQIDKTFLQRLQTYISTI